MAVTFTNKYNIPQHIVEAIIQDDHITNGDISVTQLIDSPQIRILKKLHGFTMDVMDLIPAVMGTGLHTVLERADSSRKETRDILLSAMALRNQKLNPSEMESAKKVADWLEKFVEEKLDYKIDRNVLKEHNVTLEVDGMKISGTVDLIFLAEKSVEDYKQCKANAYTHKEFKKSWNDQLNVYAAMLRENGIEIEQARIHAFFKDWGKASILRNASYPKNIYEQMHIQMISHDLVMNYIKKRVAVHKLAEETGQAVCSSKERWAKSPLYKVMKKGNKKSSGNMPSQELAENKIKELTIRNPADKNKYSIEFVPGENTRCNDYCPVAEFCPQRRAELLERADNSNEIK